MASDETKLAVNWIAMLLQRNDLERAFQLPDGHDDCTGVWADTDGLLRAVSYQVVHVRYATSQTSSGLTQCTRDKQERRPRVLRGGGTSSGILEMRSDWRMS